LLSNPICAASVVDWSSGSDWNLELTRPSRPLHLSGGGAEIAQTAVRTTRDDGRHERSLTLDGTNGRSENKRSRLIAITSCVRPVFAIDRAPNAGRCQPIGADCSPRGVGRPVLRSREH
jgi:hypothetical protein